MAEHVPEYLKNHDISGDELAYALGREAATLLDEVEDGGRKSKTLVKESGVTVVLMGMASGNVMEEHHAPGVVTVQVLQGNVTLTSAEKSVEGKAGTLVAYAAGRRHALRAEEKSAVLLTVTPGGA